MFLALLAIGGARDAAAEILFQEDFEDGNLTQRGWYDVVGWGTQLLLSTAEHVSGTASVEVRYPAGGTGPWMRHQFAGHDRIYTRYYRKWPATWQWPTSYGPHDTYIFGMYGQPWFAPTDTYVTIYTDEIYSGAPAWQFGSIGLAHKESLQGRGSSSPRALATPTPRLQLGRWYCIETMATMNTPGTADGRLQLWLDGVPIVDVNNALLRDAANAALQFDSFMFGPYFHGGAPQAQSTWIDALVVATDRVGCLGDTTPPSAPTNLRISTTP